MSVLQRYDPDNSGFLTRAALRQLFRDLIGQSAPRVSDRREIHAEEIPGAPDVKIREEHEETLAKIMSILDKQAVQRMHFSHIGHALVAAYSLSEQARHQMPPLPRQSIMSGGAVASSPSPAMPRPLQITINASQLLKMSADERRAALTALSLSSMSPEEAELDK